MIQKIASTSAIKTEKYVKLFLSNFIKRETRIGAWIRNIQAPKSNFSGAILWVKDQYCYEKGDTNVQQFDSFYEGLLYLHLVVFPVLNTEHRTKYLSTI